MRKRFLYLRLATANLWKNRQTYVSFFLSTVCTIFIFYTFCMIALNDGIKSLRGAGAMQVMMVLGAIVVSIFAFAFLFYANSFLIKRRKKELGLYAILGLEKKHIARILFHETVMLLLLSLLCGIGLGIALSKLMFLIIQALMRVPTPIVFEVTPWPLLLTVGLFAAVFFLLLLYNRLQVHLSSPVNLLKGQQKGEKEPKTRWLLAMVGVISMAAGYILANTVDNPMMALFTFFLAVLLVIMGTYALFTAGSIAFLKMLRHKKGFYYKPRNFISVSGMIYRMKQNAAGLASICILSTMAIITIGTTVALYIGQEAMLRESNPTDYMITYQDGLLDDTITEQIIHQQASVHGVSITQYHTGSFTETAVYREGNTLRALQPDDTKSSQKLKNIWTLKVFPLSEYNRMTNSNESLVSGEALIFEARDVKPANRITAGTIELEIKKNLDHFPLAQKGSKGMDPPLILVVSDHQTALNVIKSIKGSEGSLHLEQGFWWSADGPAEALAAHGKSVRDSLSKEVEEFSYSDINNIRSEEYALFGGFLFLGVFLGLLFLMATTLIIYFKQVSEGYMDHERFIILQKVGMDKDEVKRTVRKQILMVFILPIIAAILHTWGALHMMTQMLSMFGLWDTQLIALSIFVTAGIFALLYATVYSATARTYYKMVRMEI